jgi:CarD family transcriptional regulator
MTKASTAKKSPVKSAEKPKAPPKTAAKVEKKVAAPKAAPVAKAAAPAPVAPVVTRRAEFKVNDHVVYPAHGVGQIVRIEEQEVAGYKLELFVITFEKDKMTLRVPTPKAKAIGMRKLAGADTVLSAMQTLRGRARIKRTMWSRRAQEYEAKINSGDLISIAEVVRDLHRAGGQPEQSYSERQLYEAALSRMVREVAAVERIDEDAAMKRLESALTKHGGAAAPAAAVAPAPATPAAPAAAV